MLHPMTLLAKGIHIFVRQNWVGSKADGNVATQVSAHGLELVVADWEVVLQPLGVSPLFL